MNDTSDIWYIDTDDDREWHTESAGQITWQTGMVSEVGRNGAYVEDVLLTATERILELDGKLPCIENTLAIGYINLAIDMLQHRQSMRKRQGVWSTDQEHRS